MNEFKVGRWVVVKADRNRSGRIMAIGKRVSGEVSRVQVLFATTGKQWLAATEVEPVKL